MPVAQQYADRTTRKAMKLNVIEGAFAVSSDNFAGPYLGLFALMLGATPSQIGMLNAFPSLLGNILQIPYGILAEKTGQRKLLCLIGGLWARLSWLLIAFVPFMVAEEQRVPILIVLVTLRVTLGSLGVPAWTSIQADIIPRSVRGKYFANRNAILNICGLLTTFVAARLLGLTFPVNYQTLFVAAVITGAASSLIFARLPVPPARRRTVEAEPLGIGRRISQFATVVRNNRNFSSYCLSALVWNMGVSTAGPLISVYYIRVLNGSPEFWAIVTASSIVAGIFCQRYWGKLVDRFGQKNVMSIAGIGAVMIPLLWFSIPHSYLAVLVNMWGGFMWGGYNLAAFNLLLDVTPEEDRSMYIGVFNTLMGLATTIGPLVGGFLAEIIGLRLVMLLSFALRGTGLFLFNRNVDNPSDRRLTVTDLLPKRRPFAG